MTLKAYGCHMDPYPANLGQFKRNPGGPKADNFVTSAVYK